MTPRSEPLLWLQLIALGAIPLELLLLFLVLGGADPGPLPGLERLLAWGLGALAPLVLLWRQPADPCSLLLVKVPLNARSPQQLKLSALQDSLTPKLLAALGGVCLLPLFWILDDQAAVVTAFSPVAEASRLVVLVLSIPLLALVIWQWQQLSQAVWMLTRSNSKLDNITAIPLGELGDRRLCLGLPLLLLGPLSMPTPQPEDKLPEVERPETSVVIPAGGSVAVEPEQPTEESDGSQLDEEVS